MKFKAGVCEFKDGRKYIGLYNFHHDIYARTPPTLKGSTRVLHFTYKKGGQKGGGDIFFLPDSIKEVPTREIGLTKSIRVEDGKYDIKDLTYKKRIGDAILSGGNLKNSMEEYDIQFEVVRGQPKVVQEQAMSFGEVDIVYFCEDRLAKDPRGSRIDLVEKIIPRTKIKKIEFNKKSMMDGGKGWFVPVCNEANIDEGLGCPAEWVPGEGASFDGEYFTNYFWSPPSGCYYCYSDDKHKCPPKTVHKFEKEHEERFLRELDGDCRVEFGSMKKLGRPVDVLRMGKLVDPWMPGVTENAFKRKLELMIGKKARAVVTSKFIPFSDEINNLLERSGSLYLMSFGEDNVQEGPCLWGMTEEWKFEQFLKFREAGNNAIPYVMAHLHLPPTEREIKFLELETRIQLLTPRYKKNKGSELVQKMTGQTWSFLKKDSKENKKLKDQLLLQGEYEEPGRGSHILYHGELICKDIHPTWKKIIGNNKGRVRLCHHDDELTYCGGCFHRTLGITETVHVEKQKNSKYRRRDASCAKKKTHIQKELF